MCLLRYQCTVHRTVISLEDLAFVSAGFFLVYSLVFRFGERVAYMTSIPGTQGYKPVKHEPM